VGSGREGISENMAKTYENLDAWIKAVELTVSIIQNNPGFSKRGDLRLNLADSKGSYLDFQ